MRVYLFLLLFFTSCGYRWGQGIGFEEYRTVCIPYVQGDHQGILTAALTRAMTTNGALAYCSYDADLVLRVSLCEPIDTNIGFAYMPERGGGTSNVVVSNEARLTQSATIHLIDTCTGNCIIGPCEITTSTTYDFEPDLSNINFHAFSLGQLEMHTQALDAVIPSLYALLAEKIVNYINHSW